MKAFIWTEAYNCGELLNPMLESFIRHNKYTIYVFGTEIDHQKINFSSEYIKKGVISNNRFINKIIEKSVLRGYKSGHKGTAILWANLISKRTEDLFIHLDADTIFLDNVIDEIIFQLNEKDVAIAGSRRPYREREYRLNGKDHEKLNSLPDSVNTDCFGFKRKSIKKLPRMLLRRKIQGRRTSVRPVIDFFDPITHDLIKDGKIVAYLDSPLDGFHGRTNDKSQFHSKRISFAAVGSGINFFKNPNVNTSAGYREFALKSYSLYSKYILDQKIDIPTLDDPILEKRLKSLDKSSWTLKTNQ